jgi:hypothetical protein
VGEVGGERRKEEFKGAVGGDRRKEEEGNMRND